jgi:lipopolysaccharide export system permease protein
VSLLFKYLTRQIVGSFAVILGGLILLFGLFDMIGELDQVHAQGYTASRAFLFVLLGIPGRIQELLPIAALIGAIFALVRLAMNSEFTVMRASGLSLGRLASHMILLGLLFGAANLVVGEYIAPPAERLAQQIKIRSTQGIVAQEFRSGLWAKDGHTFINIRQLLPDSTLLGVRMYEFDDHFQLRRIRLAESARWTKASQWELKNVTDTLIDPTGTRINQQTFAEWKSPITPDLLSALMVNPDRMALTTLWSYVNYLKDSRQKATRYEIALWNKLAAPLAAPVMLLLALPFAYQQPRSGKLGTKVLLGIMIGLGFHLLNRVFGHIGLLGDWPPAVSALLPLTLFTGAALVALWRTESR